MMKYYWALLQIGQIFKFKFNFKDFYILKDFVNFQIYILSKLLKNMALSGLDISLH